MKPRAILFFVVAISIFAGVFSYQPLWEKAGGFRPWSLGLDIAGGSSLLYDVDLKGVDLRDRESVLSGLRSVIERRVNLFGVSEPRVYLAKSGEASRLTVELAGVKNIQGAIDSIGLTPFLDFREAAEKTSSTTAENATGSSAGEIGYDFIPTSLNGRFVKGAELSFDDVTGSPIILISFDGEGGKMFAEITGRNIGRPLAIFLDNEPLQIATVQGRIEGGRAQITGKFSVSEARTTVERFNAGALPAPITLVDQRTVSPELGRDSLKKAIVAGALGTLFVMLFMVLYYKRLGIFASLSLLIYIVLTLGIFKFVPITMTLAGVAGFLLSIGMAVDANILVFERTKEELKRGLAYKEAVEEGFKRAWTSIRDSNVSTIITSVILYYFTSSFVRGFALTLLVGVIMSMFSAITVTRAMLRAYLASDKSK